MAIFDKHRAAAPPKAEAAANDIRRILREVHVRAAQAVKRIHSHVKAVGRSELEAVLESQGQGDAADLLSRYNALKALADNGPESEGLEDLPN